MDYNRLVPIFITIDRKSKRKKKYGSKNNNNSQSSGNNKKTRNTHPVIMAMRINEYLPMRGNAHKFYSLLRIDSKLKVIECKKFCVMWMRNVFRKVRCKWILWMLESKALLLTYQCTPLNSIEKKKKDRERGTHTPTTYREAIHTFLVDAFFSILNACGIQYTVDICKMTLIDFM